MQRTSCVEINGKKFSLNFSVGAWIELEEKYDDVNSLIKSIVPDDRNYFETGLMRKVVEIASVLMRYGYERDRLFNIEADAPYGASELLAVLTKLEYVELYAAVLNAIQTGQKRTVEAEPPKKAKATPGK